MYCVDLREYITCYTCQIQGLSYFWEIIVGGFKIDFHILKINVRLAPVDSFKSLMRSMMGSVGSQKHNVSENVLMLGRMSHLVMRTSQ